MTTQNTASVCACQYPTNISNITSALLRTFSSTRCALPTTARRTVASYWHLQLETDKKILLEKARKALLQYDMRVVVGNLLDTRYDVVTLVTLGETYEIRKTAKCQEIESALVAELIRLHSRALAG